MNKDAFISFHNKYVSVRVYILNVNFEYCEGLLWFALVAKVLNFTCSIDRKGKALDVDRERHLREDCTPDL